MSVHFGCCAWTYLPALLAALERTAKRSLVHIDAVGMDGAHMFGELFGSSKANARARARVVNRPASRESTGIGKNAKIKA